MEEICIGSTEEDDPFVSNKAATILRKLAKNKRELVSLMEEAADLLEEEVLLLEEAKEVFKSGIATNTNSTVVSEKLFQEYKNVSKFHLMLALGYKVKEETKAHQSIKKDKLYCVQTFDVVAEKFEVKKQTLINNLNDAMEFHNRHKEQCDSARQKAVKTEDSPTRAAKGGVQPR